MRRMTRFSALGLLLALFVTTAPGLSQEDKLANKVRTANEVYRELITAPDRKIPHELMEDSACIAIIPSVIKGAFVWGGRHGRGVLSCRNDKGDWSPPSFVSMSGGSFGLQAGAQATDFVLFFMTRRSVESLIKSEFTLGGDASVAAGPFGRTAEASTDLYMNAEILSYARSRGLFAGVSLEGARLATHQKSIQRYYGSRIYPEKILFDHDVPRIPAEAEALIASLP